MIASKTRKTIIGTLIAAALAITLSMPLLSCNGNPTQEAPPNNGSDANTELTKDEWDSAFKAINNAKPDPNAASPGTTVTTSFFANENATPSFRISSNKSWQVRYAPDFSRWTDEFDRHTYDEYENKPYEYCSAYLIMTKNGKCYRADRQNANEEFEEGIEGTDKWHEYSDFNAASEFFCGIIEGYIQAFKTLEGRYDSANFISGENVYEDTIYFTRTIVWDVTSDYIPQASEPSSDKEWHKANLKIKFNPETKKLEETTAAECKPNESEPYRTFAIKFTYDSNASLYNIIDSESIPPLP